jgi:hypothetical protein
MRAYVLIDSVPGRTVDLHHAVAGVDGVVTVSTVAGPCDAIAVIEAADGDHIEHIVLDGIHAVPGVVRTITCPVGLTEPGHGIGGGTRRAHGTVRAGRSTLVSVGEGG